VLVFHIQMSNVALIETNCRFTGLFHNPSSRFMQL
jgi:hypothetical protein